MREFTLADFRESVENPYPYVPTEEQRLRLKQAEKEAERAAQELWESWKDLLPPPATEAELAAKDAARETRVQAYKELRARQDRQALARGHLGGKSVLSREQKRRADRAQRALDWAASLDGEL